MMDTFDNEMTLDTFLSWKIEALRSYLGKRGLAKDKPKQELAALAFSAHLLNLPIVPTASESLKQNLIEYRNLLLVEDSTIPDPFTLNDGWIDEMSGIGQWPPIFLSDIIEYAGVPDSNISIHRFLQQYKLGKGQSFIDSEHSKEIFLHNLTPSRYCLLRSECSPSQRAKDDSHKLWICVCKETGSIKSSYCTCTAGLGSACIHVAATLFRVETAHWLGVSSCTSLPCSWQTPSSKTEHLPTRLKNLKIVKPQHGVLSSKKRPLVADAKLTFQPLEDQEKKDCLTTFATALRKSLPNACLFKGLDVCEEPVNHTLSLDQIKPAFEINKFTMEMMTKNGLKGPNTTPLSKEAVEGINKATIGQSTNKQWHIIRQGRLTSSNFHNVSTKLRSNKEIPHTDSLLSNIMGYTSVNPNLKPLKHGRQMEPVARSEYIKLYSKTHSNTISEQCGIYVDSVRPYLAASPDLLVSCSCCGNGLAEFKCPLIPKCDTCGRFCECKLPACLKLESGGLKLKHTHAYYDQIQGQMAIVGRAWCDFFIYTCNGVFCERVQFDQEFYEKLLCDLDYFFTKYMLPEMCSKSMKKKLSCISEEPMEVDTPPAGNVFFCPVCKKVIDETVTSYKAQSVQCDLCKLWYHFPCVNMTKALISKLKAWKCSKCSL